MTQTTYPFGKSGDTRLAALAAEQHGVVSTAQLHDLGYSDRMLCARTAAARLQRVHRGVYVFGHPRLTLRGRWMAAVLACGEGAVLSHHAAAALHDLRRAPWTPIDVTASTRHRLDGIRSHHARRLHAEDTTVVDAIPVTAVSRLMLDMAETLSAQHLRSLLEASQRAGSFDLLRFDAVLERNSCRHGAKPLKTALSQLRDEPPWIQSKLESRFLELIRAHGLPEPATNVIVEGILVDCLWRERGLIVEIDGWGPHRTRRSFESDRVRDAQLVAAGWRVVRFTWDRVVNQPAAVVRVLQSLLSRERAAPRPATQDR